MVRLKGEKKYYPTVRKWLEKNGYFCGGYLDNEKEFYYDLGTTKSRVDVVGVRNAGNWLVDTIEIVAVEVKDEGRITQKHFQQALGNSSVAHKCYLATTAEVTPKDRSSAASIGIGLLRLLDKESPPKELLSPQLKQPSEATMLEFLANLNILQCTLCKCFFFWSSWYSDGKKITSYKRMRRARQFHLVQETDLDPFDDLTRLRREMGGYVTKRFLCKACYDQFFLPRKRGT